MPPSCAESIPSRRAATTLLAVLSAALSAAAVVLAPGATAAAGDQRASAVVVLGDSVASGEGAGDYEPGTRGEDGNWCHRSAHAYVHHTGVAQESVNLACSGAESANVRFDGPSQHTEGSQAQRLTAVAQQYRVSTVVVQLGANDDAALTATGIACIRAFLDPRVPPCRETVGPLVADRMAATAEKVEAAVADVRAAMRHAGYAGDAYQLVLASYPSPVSERMLPLQAVRGCPYSRADAGWGAAELFPALSAELAGVAERTGARFLDLRRATEGYEACTREPWTAEWQRRITVDPQALVYGGLDAIGYRLAQESFHPTEKAHTEVGRCLGDLIRSTARRGACVAGADGQAWLETETSNRAAPAA